MRRSWFLFLAAASAACDKTEAPYSGPPVGIIDDSILFPFPSVHLMREDAATATGLRVAIPEGLLPVSECPDCRPMDVERFNRRDGFSTVQPIVVLLGDQDIDPASLPGEDRIEDSLAPGATVMVIDVATGERIPLFAEMDHSPDATGPHNRTMIVRVQRAMEFAKRYAVVLTTGIRTRGGGTAAPPPRFAALRDGRSPHPALDRYVGHYRSLLDALERHGVPRSSIALAWDFWTASDESIHATFDHVLAATRADLPADPGFEPDYVVTSIEDASNKPDLNPLVLRRVRGTFSLAAFVPRDPELPEDGMFVLDADGMPVRRGRRDVVFLTVVPAVAAGAPAGSLGVLIYGHGLLDSPEWPLGSERDPDSVMRLANDLRLVVIGTEWSGLSERDELDAAAVSVDFGLFPSITEELQQGVANTLALERLVRTRFREADFLRADGGGSLLDPDRTVYYGISLGGIKGATFMANAEHVRYGVLHVAGGAWGLMMERSSNWEDYDRYARQWTPNPVDRQVLYSASQMFWDPVDPITHVPRLRRKSLLWQEAVGDAQVSNLASRLIARSVGAPLLLPSPERPCCMDERSAPLPPGSSALAIYDPDCGRPGPGNVPAEDNRAHGAIRNRPETLAQIAAFLAAGGEGAVIHPCGAGPCAWTGCR